MIISGAALAENVFGLAVESELAIGQRASDGTALTVTGIAWALGVGNAIAIAVVIAVVFAAFEAKDPTLDMH